MNEENQSPEHHIPSYVTRSREVQEIEIDQYLKQHRRANGIKKPPAPDNLSGLCISGGGVRSATLGLGMLQAFIKAGKLKYFDYLSTVSGGGYIGACLSSLLSAEPARRDKSYNNEGEAPIENHNARFQADQFGLNEDNSPFTNEPYEYPKLEHAKLNTRHQLIHLRQHGEYLTPHKSIVDWDMHRLMGALTGGIVTNFSIFLLLLATVVLLHHFLLAFMSGDQFVDKLRKPTILVNQVLRERQEKAVEIYCQDSVCAINNNSKLTQERPRLDTLVPFDSIYYSKAWPGMSTSTQLSYWFNNKFGPQAYLVWIGVLQHWDLALVFAVLGFLLAIIFILWSRKLPYRVVQQEQEEQDIVKEEDETKFLNRRSEADVLDVMEMPLIKWFYHVGLWVVPLAAYIVTAAIKYEAGESFNFFVMLALPFCYSLGLFLGIHTLIFLYFMTHGREVVSGWWYRSFYTGMQGGAFLILLLTFLFPIAIILLFGDHGLAVDLSLSFVPVMVAYYFTMQSLGARTGGGGFLSSIVSRLQNPLLNISIFLFVGLAFAWVSKGLFWLENLLNDRIVLLFPFNQAYDRTILVLILLVISALFLTLLGFVVNFNDLSLHYFYRDRLSEAYLRTSGRVEVKVHGALGGKKLQRITMRNHEDLHLKDLGEGNYKAPYHLIVTALNLQGSHDLSAKTLKSEHFVFSKFFIGSRSTGYASTSEYYYGSTKLSTAMAISAAAISSGMGPIGFAASNFYMTLFNLRTGYWIDNPKHFIHRKALQEKQQEAENTPESQAKKKKIHWTFWDSWGLWWEKWHNKHPFWLSYVGKELTGALSANTQKVYVSDGGHTGDNLGLIPLIQRQCSTIVVADFEEDSTFSFVSFNQAVRLAKSIYNADIDIDLTQLMPKAGDNGVLYSPASVVEGIITYNIVEEKKDEEGNVINRTFSKKTAQLIYMKSSVSLLKGAAEVYDENAAPPPVSEPAPVYVLNYFRKNPRFPHQSTADQYFDEVQFEAYRMLGEHIGKQAAGRVQFGVLKSA